MTVKALKERPILFSTPMVRAILDGRKTQTRRIIKPQPYVLNSTSAELNQLFKDGLMHRACPYGKIGDLLWVRETWADLTEGYGTPWERFNLKPPFIWYKADGDQPDIGNGASQLESWKPSIFMPRWASRITLRITNVRVERLQDISEMDAIAEGVAPLFTEEEIARRPELNSCKGAYRNYLWHGLIGKTITGKQSDAWECQYSGYDNAKNSFSSLWESINGSGSWEATPWVWVVEFERVD